MLQECEDSEFWHNFKKAAPILFCQAIEHDTNLKQLRDMSFIEELLKTKSIMRLMKDKVAKGDADVDIVEYSLATKMLETKLQILQSLNIKVENSEDETKITLNVHGSNKSIEIDLVKLREAITIHEKKVEEKEVIMGASGSSVETIDTDNITEEAYLKLAIEKITPI